MPGKSAIIIPVNGQTAKPSQRQSTPETATAAAPVAPGTTDAKPQFSFSRRLSACMLALDDLLPDKTRRPLAIRVATEIHGLGTEFGHQKLADVADCLIGLMNRLEKSDSDDNEAMDAHRTTLRLIAAGCLQLAPAEAGDDLLAQLRGPGHSLSGAQ